MAYTIAINGMVEKDATFRTRQFAIAWGEWYLENLYEVNPEAVYEGVVTINGRPLSYYTGNLDSEYLQATLPTAEEYFA